MAGIKTHLGMSVIAAGLCLSGAAYAGDVPFAITAGSGEQLGGTVDQDDSSGDMNSATGVASGPVSGSFTLDRTHPHAELDGAGLKLMVDFDHGDQSVSAHLDICPTADSCDVGPKLTLWEK
jgi:hypothetical protein